MQNLKLRTKNFALAVIKLMQKIPDNLITKIINRQLSRSATSVGSNYRSALRGRSRADFISKLSIALEEADETCYWLELLLSVYSNAREEIQILLLEANELTAILTTSLKHAKENKEIK
ncbi:four helix bundle protein [Pollutibacter soli]|uniref:four helix bundle protein n=1 Tax=Pollutibacter soli TaxID=3034157 RepID=UPI003013A5C6